MALPWFLTAGATAGLGGALLLRSWADRKARAAAEMDLRALEAGDAVLRSLQPIVAAGETLLQTASIRPVSPELVQALDSFRQQAEAALQQARQQPCPYDARNRPGVDTADLLRAADSVVGAVVRLHQGAAGGKPTELMHGEARHASARLSELAAKMAAARAAIVERRRALMPVVTRKVLGVRLRPLFR